eukprot:3248326-Ditylum_brightwellii.AAC.2
MDNGLVLVISTLHTVGNFIKVDRRKQHIALKNKKHAEKIWEMHTEQRFSFPYLYTITTSGWVEWMLLINYYGPAKDGHKLFTLSIIQDLVDKAIALSVQESPSIPSTPRLHTEYLTTASQASSLLLNNQLTISASVSPKCTKFLPNSNL